MSRMMEMKVKMCCAGCANKVRNALEKLDGVEEVGVDMDLQKVTVTGWIEQKKILKAVRKTGKRAEPWPMPYNVLVHDFHQYYDQHESFLRTRNPETKRVLKNGRFVHHHTFSYDPQPVLNWEVDGFSLLSDENPHSCTIL
ncbi:hypothetical protein Droror1_Dr00010291 [Drosera rotundifolia]